MSWQHLNQPQGWIGVISLSVRRQIDSTSLAPALRAKVTREVKQGTSAAVLFPYVLVHCDIGGEVQIAAQKTAMPIKPEEPENKLRTPGP